MEKAQTLQKCCWETWIPTCKRMKLNSFLTPHTKINSKWVKDLNVRSETPKLLEENTGKPKPNTGLGNDFLDKRPKVQAKKNPKKQKNKDYIKLNSFCTAKKTINKSKRQLIECEKIYANHISDKKLISKIYLKKLK